MLAEAAKNCLVALIENLETTAKTDPRLSPFVAELQNVDTNQDIRGPRPRLEHSAMAHLERAVHQAPQSTPLGRAAVQAARHLDWLQLYGGGGIDPDLANGMLAAQIAGSYGCFPSEHIGTGQFLLAPGIAYPLHTHAAVELYYCLSGTLTLQHGKDGERFKVPAGSYSITPAHRLHALWTSDEPVLLAYTWIGNVTCPIWLWEEDDHGEWTRSSWKRPPGSSWQVERTEKVTPEIMHEAHN